MSARVAFNYALAAVWMALCFVDAMRASRAFVDESGWEVATYGASAALDAAIAAMLVFYVERVVKLRERDS